MTVEFMASSYDELTQVGRLKFTWSLPPLGWQAVVGQTASCYLVFSAHQVLTNLNKGK